MMKEASLQVHLICVALLIMVTSAAGQDLQYVNSIYWCGAYDVQVRDHYAYYCFSPGLVIFDVSDIEQPSIASRLYMPGDNRNIVVSDSYAFIFGYHDSLRIVDIEDPEDPWLVGDIAIDAEVDNIWVQDDYIFAAAGIMGMLIIDISDPSAPEIIAEYPAESDIESIVVVDTVAFIAGRFIYPSSEPFQIISIADVYNPWPIGYVDENMGWNHDMIVDGDYAYLANTYEGLVIVDISSLSAPFILTQLEDITYPRVLGKVDDFLFMDFGFDTLQVFEVSEPAIPEQVGFYEIGKSAMDFEILDGFLFVAGDDLPILDISEVGNIRQVSGHEIPGATISVFGVGDYLYTAEAGLGLHIHDITDPVYPEEVSRLELPGYWYEYYLSQDYLYKLAESELGVIDISDPSSPEQISVYAFDRDFYDVCVDEPYIYLTSFNWGVSVYQRISPDSLEFIRNFSCYEYSFDVEIENNVGYFSQCFALNIYDLSNPADSVLLGSIMPVSGAGQLYYHDGFIYTQSVEGGCDLSLSIIDVRDPSNPMEVNQLYLPGYVSDVHFDDNRAYFSVYQNELFVYDVSDPGNPMSESHYRTPGYMRNSLPWGDYVYVADNTSLVILEHSATWTESHFETPPRFSLSANHPNPFNSSTVIRYSLPSASRVTVEIYDILGRKVATLLDGEEAVGEHSLIWNAGELPSGLYFSRITAGERTATGRMLLLK
jgi:hypothetical protein